MQAVGDETVALNKHQSWLGAIRWALNVNIGRCKVKTAPFSWRLNPFHLFTGWHTIESHIYGNISGIINEILVTDTQNFGLLLASNIIFYMFNSIHRGKNTLLKQNIPF